jgi:hypothetical protein
MPSAEELFSAIESHRFSALVNVASNLKTFLRALDAQPEVRSLAGAMASPEVRSAVLARVAELAAKDFDQGYENPWDSALAAYLWLLSTADPEMAAAAAARIRACSRCWWANKVAEKAQPATTPPTNGPPAGSGTGTTTPAKTS